MTSFYFKKTSPRDFFELNQLQGCVYAFDDPTKEDLIKVIFNMHHLCDKKG